MDDKIAPFTHMAVHLPGPFFPNNELEGVLLAARQGRLPVRSLVDALSRSQVFILIDKEIGPGETWTLPPRRW